MPGVPINAVWSAIYARLAGAGIGAPVFDHGAAERSFPWVRLGEYTESDESDTKGSFQHTIDVAIHVYSAAPGWKEANDIVDAVVAELSRDDIDLIDTPSLIVRFGMRTLVQTQSELEGDREIRHVVVMLRFFSSEV